MIIQLSTLLPLSEDEHIAHARKMMLRWVVLGFELAVLKGRGLVDAEEGRQLLESLGLVVDDEWDAMVPGERHTTVWFWLQLKARKLADVIFFHTAKVEHDRVCEVLSSHGTLQFIT
jgi:hypothetical protein